MTTHRPRVYVSRVLIVAVLLVGQAPCHFDYQPGSVAIEVWLLEPHARVTVGWEGRFILGTAGTGGDFLTEASQKVTMSPAGPPPQHVALPAVKDLMAGLWQFTISVKPSSGSSFTVSCLQYVDAAIDIPGAQLIAFEGLDRCSGARASDFEEWRDVTVADVTVTPAVQGGKATIGVPTVNSGERSETYLVYATAKPVGGASAGSAIDPVADFVIGAAPGGSYLNPSARSSFSWDLSSLAPGPYDVTGYATPVAGELFSPLFYDRTDDNTRTVRVVVEADRDGDGVLHPSDNCEFLPNPTQSDTDGDGVGDACDNCPNVANADQADEDFPELSPRQEWRAAHGQFTPRGDHSGDPCDNCVAHFNPAQIDTDADGLGNRCDPDYNQDGIVGLPDRAILLAAFGSSPGQPAWNPLVDHDGDGTITEADLAIFTSFWGIPPGRSGLACADATAQTAYHGGSDPDCTP